jgi:hypothetical protein
MERPPTTTPNPNPNPNSASSTIPDGSALTAGHSAHLPPP